MSRSQTLRAQVNARLTAAAEDIVVLFEGTIAEFVEELCRCKQENQRKQELLESALKDLKALEPRTVSNKHRDIVPGVLISSVSPGPDLNQEIQESPHIKEEPEEWSVKQEEEQQLVAVPECSAVCVKTEELSDGDIEHFSDSDNDKDWKTPLSCSAAQRETEADGDHYNPVQIRDMSMEPQNSGADWFWWDRAEMSDTVHNEDMSGIAERVEEQRYECTVCKKAFWFQPDSHGQIGVPAGDKPFRCSSCEKTNNHIIRTPKGEVRFPCAICKKTFARKTLLIEHIRTHTGEKPFNCTVCKKAFAKKSNLTDHMRTHTGDKPHSCLICEKTFARKNLLKGHMRTHTGEKPFSCTICKKAFGQKSNLTEHMRTHTGDRPYSCSICNKAFAQKSHLTGHLRTHTGDKPYS